jgi:hypothetical protein
LGQCFERSLQDQKIEVFMAEGKGEMVGEIIAGPIPLVEDDPAPVSSLAAAYILFGNAGPVSYGRGNAQLVHECCVAGEARSSGNRLFLKGLHWSSS